MSTFDVDSFIRLQQENNPQRIIHNAMSAFDNIALSFSGAEDVVLIDMAVKANKNVQVFSLDTGRLHPETYQFIEKIRKHYQLNMDILSPDRDALEGFTRQKGLFSFLDDGHQECCGIRKVQPLKRKLATLDAWVTGQRKDQSPGTRNVLAVAEQDSTFGTETHPLIKFNPLANWTSEDVWNYIKMFDVPYNELHAKGFVSIGCEPCTRPTLPNQHEREGRWWWEESAHKECGLHVGNLISTSQE
ncbi:phosphoadenylyl-sulfate reductase [Marinomonas algarum]|uniref:Adenosine 5'-phosphosulfate reductase n=1 Tax=Marinomonas algarum TaxID=2883105 RepID=A0A9X1LEF0_9GAMM|nr:phosphoadenylyl-sulfate reductase [Marinomonas algarum]MCB5161338.1 phosphoadenylyl-sulfate reductase [Marinomonas algarum]